MTFEEWWEKQYIPAGIDEMAQYAKKYAERVWITAQAIEREECAKTCENERVPPGMLSVDKYIESAYDMAIRDAAAAIRARE